MSKKLFAGIAIGSAITTAVASIINASAKKKTDIKNAEIESQLKKLIEERDSAVSKLESDDERYQKLMNGYENICTFNNKLTQAFNIILNPDMIADIANIDEITLRDACLSEIENTVSIISKYVMIKSDILSDSELQIIINKVTTQVDTMCDNIKDFINDYENIEALRHDCELDEDDDDDDDDDFATVEETVSPKKLILKGIDGSEKIFETDPDIGYEIIEGSDIENNDYCIYAQNDAKLYNFLQASIKDQLASHYTAKIDPKIFENIIEDLVITISFSFINETDAEITEVAAVIPFEIFKENKNNKVYTIKEGEIKVDNIIHYFGSVNSTDINNKVQRYITESGSTKMETTTNETEEMLPQINRTEFVISSNMNDNIQYIVSTIGFNRDVLKAFIGKLDILHNANQEAWTSIYESFKDIILEINEFNVTDKLDDANKSRLCNTIQTLSRNMKRNYGQDIRMYSQSNSND